MTRLMAREMLDVVQRLSIDRSVRVVVVTGAGSDAFCPGTDTKAFLSSADNPDLEPDPLLEDMMFRIPVILYQMPQLKPYGLSTLTSPLRTSAPRSPHVSITSAGRNRSRSAPRRRTWSTRSGPTCSPAATSSHIGILPCSRRKDWREGFAAYAERRTPKFVGR